MLGLGIVTVQAGYPLRRFYHISLSGIRVASLFNLVLFLIAGILTFWRVQ
jgi:hypothetical protein